jgi:hypothetical protein
VLLTQAEVSGVVAAPPNSVGFNVLVRTAVEVEAAGEITSGLTLAVHSTAGDLGSAVWSRSPDGYPVSRIMARHVPASTIVDNIEKPVVTSNPAIGEHGPHRYRRVAYHAVRWLTEN